MLFGYSPVSSRTATPSSATVAGRTWVLGWAVAFITFLIMAVLPLGDPYYGDSSLEDIPEAEWTVEQQALINYDAPNRGIKLIVVFVLAHLGTMIAYGAADGYLVELAQREPEAIRGTIQTDVAVIDPRARRVTRAAATTTASSAWKD